MKGICHMGRSNTVAGKETIPPDINQKKRRVKSLDYKDNTWSL